MAINIVCVGKIKEKFYRDALSEYIKRLGRFTKVNVIEADEELLEGNNIDKVITREGERILAKVKGYMVLMDIGGELVTSEDIARGIKDTLVHESNITFVIGGSYGVSSAVRTAANKRISFGRITYPHQMIRVVVAEQIYRAFMINSGSTYHK